MKHSAVVVLALCTLTGAAGGAPAGRLESVVRLLTWSGYVEDGSVDPGVDWVHPFESRTGCRVEADVYSSSDEMVELLRTGDYDGVAVSGDVALDLVDDHLVEPLDVRLLPHLRQLYPELLAMPIATVHRRVVGAPIGRGANLLVYRRDQVVPPPDSWAVAFGPDQAGRIAWYDSWMTIADAALYLRGARPDLGITDPFALDRDQLDAAANLLAQQRPYLRGYWSDFFELWTALAGGEVSVAWGWEVLVQVANSPATPLNGVKPREGVTAFADVWMMARRAKHPGCLHRWIDYVSSAPINMQIAEWYGMAPANRRACAFAGSPTFCATYHAEDAAFWEDVWYWRTPRRDCGDARDADCTDGADWREAWQAARGP